MKQSSELQKDFTELCDKHGIDNAIIGYEDSNSGVGTISVGKGGKQYEISAVMFGFYRNEYHNFIGELLDYGKKQK